MTLRVGSLFSGIGGFDLGFERAGMQTAWFCEQDEFCQRVLAKHWPGVPCYPDIRDLRASDVEPVDVLCGGFPCQDISLAGKGAGIEGARSGLWSEYARLVGELRPRYVVVENVRALRSRGLHRVVGDLAALGYDAEWTVVRASDAGAPHQRARLWIVAYPNADGRGLEVGPQLDGQAQQDPADGDSRGGYADGLRHEVADPEGARLEGAGVPRRPPVGCPEMAHPNILGCDGRPRDEPEADGRPQPAHRGGPELSDWWASEPDVGRVAHGVPARVDRLRSLGNALVPQIAEWIGQRIVDLEPVVSDPKGLTA